MPRSDCTDAPAHLDYRCLHMAYVAYHLWLRQIYLIRALRKGSMEYSRTAYAQLSLYNIPVYSFSAYTGSCRLSKSTSFSGLQISPGSCICASSTDPEMQRVVLSRYVCRSFYHFQLPTLITKIDESKLKDGSPFKKNWGVKELRTFWGAHRKSGSCAFSLYTYK